MVLPATADDAKRVSKPDGAGGNMGRVLPEAVPRQECGLVSAAPEQPVDGDAHRENRRLRVGGKRQLIFRSFEGEGG